MVKSANSPRNKAFFMLCLVEVGVHSLGNPFHSLLVFYENFGKYFYLEIIIEASIQIMTGPHDERPHIEK